MSSIFCIATLSITTVLFCVLFQHSCTSQALIYFPLLRIFKANCTMATAPSQQTVPTLYHNDILLFDETVYPRTQYRPPVNDQHLVGVIDRKHRGGQFYRSLHLYSHTSEQVAAAIKSFITQPPEFLTSGQQKAIQQYRDLRALPDQNPEDLELLVKYFKTFDGMFFLGALENYCYIELVPPMSDVLGDCACHRSTDFDKFSLKYECRIRICDRSKKPECHDPFNRLEDNLETLLHECLHAMFGLYVCYAHEDCQDRAKSMEGIWGHMTAWQDAAVVIENATAELWYGRQDLARALSLGCDLGLAGLQVLPEHLERWGLQRAEVQRYIDLYSTSNLWMVE
jgi:hypothetical protein